MNNTSIIVCFLMLASFNAHSQSYNPALPVDTIHISEIKLKKVIAYKIGDVTILASYKDFMKSYIPFWKAHRKRVRSMKKDDKNVYSQFNNYYIFLDTTLKRLKKEIKTQDTTFIHEKGFARAGLGTSYFFSLKIEAGKCIVLNKFNQKEKIILRQKQTRSKGFNASWGGQYYFILYEKKAFIGATDWVS